MVDRRFKCSLAALHAHNSREARNDADFELLPEKIRARSFPG